MDEQVVPVQECVDKVVAWRQEVLERHGFEPAAALRLASDRSIDVRRACDLIDAGCAHTTAVRILG